MTGNDEGQEVRRDGGQVMKTSWRLVLWVEPGERTGPEGGWLGGVGGTPLALEPSSVPQY